MLRALLVMTALATLAVGFVSAANAGTISVANASFEIQPQSPGGFTYGSVPDWLISVGGSASVFYPLPSEANSAPDGNQVAATGAPLPGAIYQDLGVGVVVGDQYELDVFVGTRKDGLTSNYLVELLVGNTTIGSQSGTPTADGSFFSVTVSAIGSGVGDLGVRLSQIGPGQTLWDDVRVFNNNGPTAVPEPSTLAMSSIMFCVFGTAWVSKRMKRMVPVA